MKSARLSDKDLVEIAETKTQAHLLAISSRPRIGTAVTDVLLQRGDGAVFHKLAENAEANFSERGFAALVRHAERDDQLAEKVGLRFDIPLRLFRELLTRATEAVRAHLLALCPPESLGRIQSVLATICTDVKRAAGIPQEQDYVRARARVRALHNSGELDDRAILEFARTLCYAEIVAALSLLSEAPVKLMEKLLQSEHLEAFLIPCKAAGLSWPTARLILTCRTIGRQTSGQDLDQAERDYQNLSINNAQRVLRFWQVRQAARIGAEHSPDEADRIAV